MEFYPTNEYREVTLQTGLNSVQLGNTDKLFSDGLEEDEYIYFDDSKGFCYEDGCVIGGTYDKTLNVLHSLKWCFNHKFYVKKNKIEKQKEEARQLWNVLEHIINLLESDDERYSFEGGTGHSIRIYDKEIDIGYVGHFEPIKYDADGNATNLQNINLKGVIEKWKL